MMGMMGGAQSYAMANFDTNKDGTLSPEEMTAGIKAEIKKYDTDANGSLSLEEFAVMHAAHTRSMTVRAFQTVSYTHLDVYKRQPPAGAMVPASLVGSSGLF